MLRSRYTFVRVNGIKNGRAVGSHRCSKKNGGKQRRRVAGFEPAHSCEWFNQEVTADYTTPLELSASGKLSRPGFFSKEVTDHCTTTHRRVSTDYQWEVSLDCIIALP